MTIPIAGSPARPTTGDTAPLDPDLAAWTRTGARAVLAHALLLGVAADALLRRGPTGVAFPLWIGIGVLGAISLAWRTGRTVNGEARAWLATAILFAAGLAWRDTDRLRFLDVVAAFGALTMAGVAFHDRRCALFAERLRETLRAFAAVIGSAAVGMLPLVLRDVGPAAVDRHTRSRTGSILRASLITAAVLIIFGSLLRDADPIFASVLTLPELDVATLISHLFVIGFFTWLLAGWARRAMLTPPSAHPTTDALPFRLGRLDVTAMLGALNLLFALFVLSQLGWFFGGESFLRARTGLTAAEYARQGFFQLVWVVALVVPLLLITRAALAPGRNLARRHTLLALPVIALLFAIIVSAVLRMRMYVGFYGLTTDRLYPVVFMGWLAVVLTWLAVTVLQDRGRPFAGGAVVSGGLVLALLNVASPDAIVARVNVTRAERLGGVARSTLDLPYLASLGAEAVDRTVRATLEPSGAVGGTQLRGEEEERRCAASRMLLSKWGPNARHWRELDDDAAAWRHWNAGEQHARRIVAEHAASLRDVTHGSCRYRLGR